MTRQVISLDMAARLIAESIGAVLKALASEHSVAGVAVFHIDNSYLVDMNFLGPESLGAWSISIQLASDTPEESSNA